MNILILTRCSRPYNLAKIEESIKRNKRNDVLYRWCIAFDMDIVKKEEIEKLNIQDENIKFYYEHKTDEMMEANFVNDIVFDEDNSLYDYVYLLDDDNIIHPNFFKIMNEINVEHKCAPIILFNQIRQNGINIVNPCINENSCVCIIDSAQFLLPLERLRKMGGYVTNNAIDGPSVRKFFLKYGSSEKLIINEVGAYYNFLSNGNPCQNLGYKIFNALKDEN